MSESKQVEFSLSGVEAKPPRKYRKGSKYNPILNQFLEQSFKGKTKLMRVDVPGKEANYMRTQFKKIIDKDKLAISVSVVNNTVYLERVEPVLVKPIK